MNKNIKIAVAVLMILGGLYLMIFTRELGWGIVIFLLSALPILLYFKNEHILTTLWFMRKQEMDKAIVSLNRITNYQVQLHRSQYGYYNYLMGITLAQDHPAKVEPYMKKALEYGLNMQQDRAMATLNLAASALSKGRRQEGTRLLEEAKRLDTAGMLTEHIKTIKDQLKAPNMQRHMQNPHMRQRGKF